MKKKPTSQSAFFNPRIILSFVLCSIGVFLALLGCWSVLEHVRPIKDFGAGSRWTFARRD